MAIIKFLIQGNTAIHHDASRSDMHELAEETAENADCMGNEGHSTMTYICISIS